VCPVDVSGNTARYSLAVRYDAAHAGVVTLRYGAASQQYSWAAGTLTSGDIHTFPSSFTVDGSANGYGATYGLKVGSPGSLTLKFAGGDRLHSSSVSAQVEYVRYTQGNVTKPLTSLTCSDDADTITVASLTPADATELTLHVKLRGPESASALSLDLYATVSSAEISPAWEAAGVTTARSASVLFFDGWSHYRIVGDQLFPLNGINSFGTGAWYSKVAYAINAALLWGWLLVQFEVSSSTVRCRWLGHHDTFVPTEANIEFWTSDIMSTVTAYPWTGNLPVLAFGHTLVVDSPVELYFRFTDLPSAAITSAASFTVTLNGSTTPLPLGSARLVGTSLMLPYTALAAVEHVFTLAALGQSMRFVVPASAVFTFPTVGTTTMVPPYVTLGQSVELTTTFASAFPSAATATTVVSFVTPQGTTATGPLATTVSGQSSAVVSHTVLFDSQHAGAITVTYGPASKVYSWAALSSPLTEGSIYTFPSGFTLDGTANAYGSGFHLKATTPGALQLTFVGGDRLHSTSAAAQVSYVTYTQGSTVSPVLETSLVCTLPASMSVSAVTPADTTALTLTVKLKGPDGAPMSGIIYETVPSAQIAPAQTMLLLLDAGDTSSYPISGRTALNGSLVTWNDLSGMANHGTFTYGDLNFGVTYSSANGGSLAFAGGSYISLPQFQTRTNQPISMFAFVNPSNATGDRGIWNNRRSDNRNCLIELNGGMWRVRLGDLDKERIALPTLNQWQHVGFTYDGTTGSFYVNGTSVSTWLGLTGNILGPHLQNNIGDSSVGARPWNGKISHVTYYTRSLTSAEISLNFALLRGRYGI
jgi:hypothetical protein